MRIKTTNNLSITFCIRHAPPWSGTLVNIINRFTKTRCCYNSERAGRFRCAGSLVRVNNYDISICPVPDNHAELIIKTKACLALDEGDVSD